MDDLKEIEEILRRNYFYTDKHGVGRQTPLNEYVYNVATALQSYMRKQVLEGNILIHEYHLSPRSEYTTKEQIYQIKQQLKAEG